MLIDRILKIIELNNITKSEFYRKTGLSNGFLDKVKDVGASKLEQILKTFPEISEKWLLTGVGEMIKNEEIKNEATPITAGHVKYIPLVSQYAQAGYLGGFDNKVYMDSLPKMPIIIPSDQEPKGEYICFEVSGDSMISDKDPAESIFEHDLLICRNVNPIYWTSKLHINKWDFVITHKTEGIIVKRIIDHNVEKGEITIHSLNPLYEDRVLSLNDISQLHNVVFINRQMRR
ncbi:MAG: hypothetical protein LBE34_13760 [Flavobacteriaceae bacterium]|jgi:phage repressor protein C with HTH and peptisase S24 domain|nr:hypothetical protein [Flavobacteriaceae bacterium]